MQWSTGHSISCEPMSWLNFEAQRARARQLDRPAEPRKAMAGEFEHRLAAVFLVEQHAVAGTAVGDLAPPP